MKYSSRSRLTWTTAALATIALVGGASPAFASSPASPVPNATECPDRAATTFGELEYAMDHGDIVDEYPDDDGTIITVIAVEGKYEVYGNGGNVIGRICYDTQPPKLDGVHPAEYQYVGGGGGGSSIGHWVHGYNANLLTTTRWVKWRVTVN